MLNTRPIQRGFTLLEVVVTFAIIGILIVIAVPSFQHWVANAQIRNAAEGILNGMQSARAEAVRRNVGVQLVLNSGSGWTINSLDNIGVAIQTRDAGEGSANSVVTTTASDGTPADRITFNGMGWIITNNNGSKSIGRVDVTSATLTGTEIRPLRIVVSSGGAMKMCDPNAAITAPDPRACPTTWSF
ncbi:MAG TPA: GspH/FimT family pseudopilin [Burkholderiales bacterium]|nr:GspH/FimT family pseudopilin [Burkholderiales bacterium]